MKRQMIYVLSAICLMMTACSGKDNSESLPEMPRNTSGMTETTAQSVTGTVPATTSSTILTTLSSHLTSRPNAGSALYTSLTVSSSTTTMTLSTASSSTTSTLNNPPATLPTVLTNPTTSAATTDRQHLIEEAEQLTRQLEEEMMLAVNNVQAARTALADANAAHEEAMKAALIYQEEHESEIALYSTGSKGFFSYVHADDALEVLEHADYAFCTEIGNEDDATSLKNMRAAFEFLKKCNALREQEGLAPLKVTDQMMAIAQSNLNWSDGNVQHSQQFAVGENLAWGYSDPFEGWYYGEKEDNGSHYQNIVNTTYEITGFAVCTANRDGRYSESHGQVFGFAGSETAYTVEEYENRFNDYSEAIQRVKTELSALQKKASDAQAVAAAQLLAVSQAEQSLSEVEEAYKKAEEHLNQLLDV
ncbi:MAG: CAP domain-containing protein [Oscillospiraceae bacterium]|nr:CAP domain-containing protein [Oscillospiraceae bacterium]